MSSITKSSKPFYTKYKALTKVSETIQAKLQLDKAKMLLSNTRKFSSPFSSKGNNDSAVRRFLVGKMGHFQYGLYTEDLIDENIVAVEVALKRLPPEVYDARVYRLVRALILDTAKEYLPKDQWITYEEDLENRYLTPYIKQVEMEMQEKREYGIYVKSYKFNE